MDTNREQITFARPDLEHLRIFCNEKFGWPFNKTDELMVPVLKVRLAVKAFDLERRHCRCLVCIMQTALHDVVLSIMFT